LTQAVRLKPDYAIAYNARGYAHHLARQFKQAIADYDEAIRLNPKYVNAYRNRGNAKRASGDSAGGDADLATATKLEHP
jgi:tetratricopeptide (TPR) repeat protein